MGFTEEGKKQSILCEAVDGGVSHLFVARIGEVREPFLDGAVGGQDEAFLFVAIVGDEVEEELDGVGIARRVAELVDDDEIEFGKAFVEFGVMAGCSLAQSRDKFRHPIEGDFFEEFARL